MWRKILILVIVILLGIGLRQIAYLPVWNIQEIEITGADYIPLDLIRAKTDRWLGKPLLLSTKKNLALDLIWIEDYQVRRRLFPVRLLIDIQPRAPLLAVPVNGQLCILDAQGVVLNQAGIAVPTSDVLQVSPAGDMLEVEFLLKNLLPLCDYLGNIYKYSDLYLDISRRNNIQVVVQKKLILKFGQAADLAEKYQALVSVLADVRPQLDRLQYIDISAYKTPAVK